MARWTTAYTTVQVLPPPNIAQGMVGYLDGMLSSMTLRRRPRVSGHRSCMPVKRRCTHTREDLGMLKTMQACCQGHTSCAAASWLHAHMHTAQSPSCLQHVAMGLHQCGGAPAMGNPKSCVLSLRPTQLPPTHAGMRTTSVMSYQPDRLR